MKIYAGSIFYHSIIHQSNNSLPYLVLLHGFMGSGKLFDHLIQPLKEFCNPVTVDLAGHGLSEKSVDASNYKSDQQVSQLVSILRRFAFDHLSIYGYSMGGRLVFQLLKSNPELFEQVFIESAHCGLNSEKERSERRQIDEIRAHKIEANYQQFVNEWMKLPLFTSKNSEIPDSELKKIYLSQDPKAMAASLRGFGAGSMPTVCDQLSEINLPVHLFAGESDQKYVELLSDISSKNEHFTLSIVQQAGHRIHQDQPESLIAEFKKRLS
ncbi:MAG: 2-succinyl-6-hydroxy-2,4-cyclohexadiene-1-carboxylate synthase [Balneolaceae bacterium]